MQERTLYSLSSLWRINNTTSYSNLATLKFSFSAEKKLNHSTLMLRAIVASGVIVLVAVLVSVYQLYLSNLLKDHFASQQQKTQTLFANQQESQPPTFDFIIVGSGTAGLCYLFVLKYLNNFCKRICVGKSFECLSKELFCFVGRSR